ncbi:hypothetical protein AB0395_39340 [Streptosporangium sp. NPDC051023]|uniref:hypothetical protein n=1 Tax=Streptosporangium sp. NPDC051023 TaxID=3155410 RepID=UPI00344DD101
MVPPGRKAESDFSVRGAEGFLRNATPARDGRHLGFTTASTSAFTTVGRNDAAALTIPGSPHVLTRADDAVGQAWPRELSTRVNALPDTTGRTEYIKAKRLSGATDQETTSDGDSLSGVPGDGLR